MVDIKIVAMANVLFLFGAASLAGQECSRLQSATPNELVLYLEGIVPKRENAACITFAIKRLEKQRYEPAIPALTKLLDFGRPLNAEEKAGVISLRTFYPAENALEEIGKTSLPSVLEAIKADLTSAKARENAVSVWMELYKYESPKGVALLKREADETNDATIKQRLLWAVSKALTWCNPPDETQCKAAAKTGYSN